MGHTLPLTAEQNAKLAAAGAESRTVTVGVRPVHVTVGDEGIDAQIDVSELMGSELHLHMTAGGRTWWLWCRPRTLTPTPTPATRR